jgi:hypothetical protein
MKNPQETALAQAAKALLTAEAALLEARLVFARPSVIGWQPSKRSQNASGR